MKQINAMLRLSQYLPFFSASSMKYSTAANRIYNTSLARWDEQYKETFIVQDGEHLDVPHSAVVSAPLQPSVLWDVAAPSAANTASSTAWHSCATLLPKQPQLRFNTAAQSQARCRGKHSPAHITGVTAFADWLHWKEERRGVCGCSRATAERQYCTAVGLSRDHTTKALCFSMLPSRILLQCLICNPAALTRFPRSSF